jgi:hypothetical protein
MDNPIFDHKVRSFDRFIIVSDKGKFMDDRSMPTRYMTNARMFFTPSSAAAGAASMDGLYPSQTWEAIAIEVTFTIK